MLIKANSWDLKSNSDFCKVWEYEEFSKNISVAKAWIDWVYPDWSKKVVNLEVEQVYYVLSWSWFIYSEFWDFFIEKWDIYFFKKWEKYSVKWNNLEVLIIHSPKRYFEQMKYIDW